MASPALTTPIASAPFDALAESYDEVFTNSLIGRAQRAAVRQEVDRTFSPGQRILEINCGTGVDAVYLAGRGVEVLAADQAPRMIAVASRRSHTAQLRASLEFRVLPTEEIGKLEEEGPFDGAFSNFGGLNCVQDLPAVARDLARLLRPGAKALLCFAGRFVAWEVVWYLGQAKPREAFRRLRSDGVLARLADGVEVHCWYSSVRSLARQFAPHFFLDKWKGVGIAVPPTYLEPLARRFPKALNALVKADRWLSVCPVVRGLADHVVLTFERVKA